MDQLKTLSPKCRISIFALSCFVVGSLLSAPQVYAATGINRTVNFQGKLVNKSDGTNLTDGNYTFIFAIYNAASAGTKLWGDETQTSVPVTNGIFQVALGSVRSFSTDNVDFNQDNLWLDVTFNGENFGSRIRLAAVPYAFTAEKVTGLTIAANKTFTVNNSITFTGTDSTSFTLPSTNGGTVLTTNQASQTINSGQTSGTILSLSAGAPALVGSLTGLTVTLNGTNAQAQTGLSFAVSGTGTLKDITGTGNNWSVTSAGGGSFATLDVVGSALLGANSTIDTRASGTLTIGSGTNTTGLILGKSGATTTFNSTTWTATPTISGLITANGGLTIASGQNITMSQLTSGSIPFLNASKVLSEDNANLFWDDINNRLGVGVNTNLLGAMDIRSNSGTLPIATLSGKTSFAALVVNNSGSGDLLTASSAGLTKFLINNSGSALFKGDTISSSSSAVLSNSGSGAVVNALGDQGSMLPNAGFEANASNSLLGDGWVKNSTSSATIALDMLQADAGQGSGSVKYTTSNTNQSAAFYSACVPLTGGVTYNLMYSQKAGAANGSTVRGYLDQYTSKANCQSNTTPIVLGPATSATVTTTYAVTGSALAATAATTTWGRAHFFIASSVNSTNATTNIDSVRLIQTALTAGLDYAENYPADPDQIPEPGEVVSLQASGSASFVAPARKLLDQSVIGVVSSNPGETLDDGNVLDPKVPVALAGRVPVKVSTINGAIHVGDYLTSSTIPGVAVKATDAGQVIGIAMQDEVDIDPKKISKITMFIKNTYFNGVTGQDDPVVLSALQAKQIISSNSPSLLDTLSVAAATSSGDIRIKGNGLVEGILHVADTLFANNFVVNSVSEFFGNVMLHGDVVFAGRPFFNSDSAGFAVIRKGSDHVTITFDKEYSTLPVITATMVADASGHDDQIAQASYQALLNNLQLIVVDRTSKGFTILLNKPVDTDANFSWNAVAIKDVKTFKSD